MTTRHVLLSMVALGVLLLSMALAAPQQDVHADDPVSARPTPTPARPPEYGLVSVPEDDFPDLIISDISISPDPVLVNRSLTIRVTVSNIGTAPVADDNNFFVDLYINPDNPPRGCIPGDDFWSVQGFEVGSNSVTLTRSIDPSDPNGAAWYEAFQDVGIVEIWAQVDGCGDVIEGNNGEDNNLAVTYVDVVTLLQWSQTTTEEFLDGFSSALDLTHPLGVLQNGTGWFVEPRFPPPEDPDWPLDPVNPWDSETFYNPDYHIVADNLPDDFPRENLPAWNPPDQENIDIQIGYNATTLFAVWEDARNGDQFDRDIYFSYGIPSGGADSGYEWLEPVRVNQDPLNNGANQLNPQLVVDREARRLFVFWQDNRLDQNDPTAGDNYDIFFARSTDAFGTGWEEPVDPATGEPSNPVNDKEIDPNADQVNVTAAAFNLGINCDDTGCDAGPTHLFVAWEDYRNNNADIFFEWSQDNGDTWLKTPDGDPTTVDDNIHVQPDPTGQEQDPGKFDQRDPYIFLSEDHSTAPIDYCPDLRPSNPPGSGHIYATNPLPRVFLVWEDERDIVRGDALNIYYTRGEFNYNPALPCNQPYEDLAKTNLPLYRFEDDHVKLNRDEGTALQLNPVGVFDDNGFVSFQFAQTYDPGTDEVFNYTCEARYPTEEIAVTWQDNRNGNFDIWSVNAFDDIDLRPRYAYVLENSEIPPDIPTEPNDAEVYCRGLNQGGRGEVDTPPDPIPDIAIVDRNADIFSPQPPEFYELALPEDDLEISNGLTFTPKPLCPTPDEVPTYTREPSEQANPDLATLTTDDSTLISVPKPLENDKFDVILLWSAWDDAVAFDVDNQDIFLRPVIRYDTERSLSVTSEEGIPIALQTVQDNVKNQVVLRELDLYEDFRPPNVRQSQPSVTFNRFSPTSFALYVGWHDNRNANPLIGFEGNKDVYAARLKLDDVLYGELRPTRTGAFLSAVFDVGKEATWYDIDWWGDISADGVVTLQTRFGYDASIPEPPQQNVVLYNDAGEVAWTQWTGVGGTGGFYTAPGQHIAGPDGERFPRSYYIQYRVNFNPAGGGQQGIACLSEINLNYETDFQNLYLPILLLNPEATSPLPPPQPTSTP